MLADHSGMAETTAHLVWAILALVLTVVVILPWLAAKMRRR